MDLRDERLETSLFSAAEEGHHLCVRELLAAAPRGADVTLRDHEGESPLAAAAGKGHLSCVKLLLAAEEEQLVTGPFVPYSIRSDPNSAQYCSVGGFRYGDEVVSLIGCDGLAVGDIGVVASASCSQETAEAPHLDLRACVVWVPKGERMFTSEERFTQTRVTNAVHMNMYVTAAGSIVCKAANANGEEIEYEQQIKRLGTPPLFAAANNGHEDCMRLLFEHGQKTSGADLADSLVKFIQTPHTTSRVLCMI